MLSGEEICYAAKMGNERLILDNIGSLNFPDSSGKSALYHALESGKTDLAKKLISCKADIGQLDSTHWNVFHVIAKHNLVDVLDYLYSSQMLRAQDFNAQTTSGLTPLMIAASFGYNEIVERLVRIGVNQKLKDSDGQCAIYKAIENDSVACLKLLSYEGYEYFDANDENIAAVSDNILHLVTKMSAVNVAVYLSEQLSWVENIWHETNAQGYTPNNLAYKMHEYDVLLAFLGISGKNQIKTLQSTVLLQEINNTKFQDAFDGIFSPGSLLVTQRRVIQQYAHYKASQAVESAKIGADVNQVTRAAGTIAERERLQYPNRP